jgi:hypothetical protein
LPTRRVFGLPVISSSLTETVIMTAWNVVSISFLRRPLRGRKDRRVARFRPV